MSSTIDPVVIRPHPSSDDTRRPGARRARHRALIAVAALLLAGSLLAVQCASPTPDATGAGTAVGAASGQTSGAELGGSEDPKVAGSGRAADGAAGDDVASGAAAGFVDDPTGGPAVAPPVGEVLPPGGAADADLPAAAEQPGVPGPPVLVVPADVHATPGATEVEFLVANAGGSPLTWSIPTDEAPTLVSPAGGVVAPGAQALVAFELPSEQLHSDMDLVLTVQSDGGTAEVTVHLVALDPVFAIVGGTWEIRNGNAFIVSYGDLDVGLTLRNLGDVPLMVEPQQVAGLDLVGGPWVLAPGQQVHLHVLLCNAAYAGGIPDVHDRDLHIHTDGWQGTLDVMVRFTLEPGDVAPAC